jgi:transposase
MVARRQFSREFKLEAIKLVEERGVSVRQAAQDLDVHENVLRKWVREHREQPDEAFPGNGKMTTQDAEIVRAAIPRSRHQTAPSACGAIRLRPAAT